ncbi:MAG: hypothetical protein ACUVRY_08280 [Thermoanaerobaculaceae bacterium]
MAQVSMDDMERKLEELARKWERYFSGDQEVPIPPERERAALARQLQVLSREEGLPFAVRFRLDGLLHRFSTYNQLWERQLRARSEARRAANAQGASSVKKVEDDVARLHREYVASMEKVGRRTSLDLAAFRKVLADQKRRLESQGLEVRGFVVVCQGNQVSLRAKARKKEGV